MPWVSPCCLSLSPVTAILIYLLWFDIRIIKKKDLLLFLIAFPQAQSTVFLLIIGTNFCLIKSPLISLNPERDTKKLFWGIGLHFTVEMPRLGAIKTLSVILKNCLITLITRHFLFDRPLYWEKMAVKFLFDH